MTESESQQQPAACRVPMWMGGVPAGFCGEPAYGPQEPGQTRYGNYGPGYRGDRWYPGGVFEPGFCCGPACYKHGGPAAPVQPTLAEFMEANGLGPEDMSTKSD